MKHVGIPIYFRAFKYKDMLLTGSAVGCKDVTAALYKTSDMFVYQSLPLFTICFPSKLSSKAIRHISQTLNFYLKYKKNLHILLDKFSSEFIVIV